MKRFPALEEFLILSIYPKINLYNHPIAWKSHSDDYETNFDNQTSISYNDYIDISRYSKFLYKKKEAVIGEIKVAVNSQPINEAKQSIANLFNSLDEPNKIQINHKYKLKEFDPEWKDAIELYGENIVLKDYNMVHIKEFDEVGINYYKEIYEFCDITYDHLHHPSNLLVFPELKRSSIPIQFVSSFSFNDKIFDKKYLKIFGLLSYKLFDTDYETFVKAFSGNPIYEPLKIKWLIQNENIKKQTAYRSLIYFLKSDLFKQEDDDKVFLAKILMVFANTDGSLIVKKNLNVSFKQYQTSLLKSKQSHKKWKLQIDELIKLLLT